MAGSLSYNNGNGVPCRPAFDLQPKPYEEGEVLIVIELAADLVT